MRESEPRTGSPVSSGDMSAPVKRITPVEIQDKQFRLAFRGYHERDVDRFLDEVTEEVARLHAENKRVREELESVGTSGPGAGFAPPEPQAPASAVAEEDAGAAAFLVREKEFLQNLAGLIQSHAQSVKEDLRRSRPSPAPDAPAEQEPSEEESVAAEPEDADERRGTEPDSESESQSLTEAWTPPFARIDEEPETEAAEEPSLEPGSAEPRQTEDVSLPEAEPDAEIETPDRPWWAKAPSDQSIMATADDADPLGTDGGPDGDDGSGIVDLTVVGDRGRLEPSSDPRAVDTLAWPGESDPSHAVDSGETDSGETDPTASAKPDQEDVVPAAGEPGRDADPDLDAPENLQGDRSLRELFWGED